MVKDENDGQKDFPSVYDFTDYRKYLEVYYKCKKRKNPRFSYRVFSRICKFSGQGYSQLVISGRRNLTEETALDVASACHLSERERQYFLALVRLNQCAQAKDREYFWQKLLECIPQHEHYLVNSDEAQIFLRWYIMPILEMVEFKDFKDDDEWIMKRFLPFNAIKKNEARFAMDLLKKLGLVKKNQNGRWIRSKKIVFAKAKDYSEIAKSYYLQILPFGKDALLQVPREDREFSSTTIVVKKEDIQAIKEDIKKLQNKILNFSSKIKDGEAIYQLSVQFFPIADLEDHTTPL